LYKDKSLAEPWRGDWNDCVRWERDGHSYHAQTAPSDESYIQQLRVGYYAAITHMDHQIGRLISALVEEQIMDNTVILFVSDHGEMLGDHLMFQKAKPFQGSIHVPLFISGPERYIGKRGTVRTDLAELRDVMPTLLELAGAPIPETVDGISLLHLVDREYMHGEHTLGEDSMHFILTKEDKYIWYSQTGRELYFNLRDDPHETKNVLEENQKRVAELRALLIDALKNREEGYTDGHTLLVGKTPVTVLQHTEVL
jgi:arylsulfatase A-like enzyme